MIFHSNKAGYVVPEGKYAKLIFIKEVLNGKKKVIYYYLLI